MSEEKIKELKNVIKNFEDYFDNQQKLLKEFKFNGISELIKNFKSLLNQIEFLQNELYILKNKESKRFWKLEKTEHKEKKALMKEFGIKSIGKGQYGEGFFDGLKVSKKYAQDNRGEEK